MRGATITGRVKIFGNLPLIEKPNERGLFSFVKALAPFHGKKVRITIEEIED
jgi:hypothetical protein